MKIVFISPCFNASRNIPQLVKSLQDQDDPEWSLILIDDMSSDKTAEVIERFSRKDHRISGIINTEKKFALRNIVETARDFENDRDVVIAVVDGDDFICNSRTVTILKNNYKDKIDCVWTAHRWDINGMNISKPIPEKVDPYQWPWSSSHLRTFRSNLLLQIPDSNFKNTFGTWFERGYDQALMLPVIKVSREHKYVNEVCYQYNINSVSVNDRDWAEKNQHNTINLVRSRGFLSK